MSKRGASDVGKLVMEAEFEAWLKRKWPRGIGSDGWSAATAREGFDGGFRCGIGFAVRMLSKGKTGRGT